MKVSQCSSDTNSLEAMFPSGAYAVINECGMGCGMEMWQIVTSGDPIEIVKELTGVDFFKIHICNKYVFWAHTNELRVTVVGPLDTSSPEV